ncbi:MAG: hypothetical protein KA419_19180 [Acidobacteria bacterium]|nr:hypothetical protein [Acidobacteriota bacterium]
MSAAHWKTDFTGDAELAWDVHPAFEQALASNRPLGPEAFDPARPLALLRCTGKGKAALKGVDATFTLSMGGGPSGRLRAFRAGEGGEDLKVMGLTEPLPEGKIALLMDLAGCVDGDASARASLARGPRRPGAAARFGALAATAGLGVEGEAVLRVLRVFPAGLGAADLLRGVLRELRLPHAAAEPGRLPAPDTRLCLSRDGVLTLTAGIALPWRAALEIPMTQPLGALLPSPLTLAFPGALRVRGNARLQSRFSLLVHADEGPAGRVLRATVRKESDREFGMGAVLGAEFSAGAAGPLPPIERVVGCLLGIDPERLLAALKGAAALDGSGGDPSDALARLLAETALAPVLEILREHLLPEAAREAVAAVAGAFLDLDGRLRDLLWDRPGLFADLEGGLRAALTAGRAANLAAALADALGPESFPLEEFAGRAGRLDACGAALDTLFGTGRPALLEKLLREVLGAGRAKTVLEALARLDTPEAVGALADEGLRRLAAAVLAEGPAGLVPDNALRAAGRVARSVLTRLETWDKAYLDALGKLFAARWRLEAGVEYLRKRAGDVLLEVEFDPRAAGAAAAFRALAGGDTGACPPEADVPGVRLLQAYRSEALRRSLKFHLQLGPRCWKSVESLSTWQSLRIVPDGDGWAQTVYLSAGGTVERGWEKGRRQHGDFRVALLAHVTTGDPRPYTGDLRPAFGAEYHLAAADPVSRPDELADLLAMAEATGLLAGRTARDVAAEALGGGPPWPAAEVAYKARVPGRVFKALLERDDVAGAVESHILEILCWSWLRHGRPTDGLRRLGGALQTASNLERFRRQGRLTGGCMARLGPAQGKARVHYVPLDHAETAVLEATFRLAREAGRAFEQLRRTGTPVPEARFPVEALADFAERLAKLHNELARWGGRLDTLPHVLHRLAPPTGLSSTALEITVTPEGAPARHLLILPG